MVPPPDNLGDNIPDFDAMTPEEQLAWLESLARRQGVRDEELITAADLNIPIPEDAVIDEPGYVPFEGSRSARELKESVGPSAPEVPMTDEVGPSGPEYGEEPTFEAVAEVGSADTWSAYEDEAAPINWLDGLAVQPIPEMSLEEWPSAYSPQGEVPEPEAERAYEAWPEDTFEAEPAMPAAAATDDPLGGIDPMLWLESLAARQGVDASQLTTAANLEIAEPPPDAVIDEPGYVPFEGSRSAREAAEQGLAPLGAEVRAADQDQVSLEAELEAEEGFAGIEAQEWLETLARRQGASEDELLTAADLELPELPADVQVDEPGYVEFEPLSILPPDHAEYVPDGAQAESAEVGYMADEGLGWLEDLAAEPSQDFAERLTFADAASEYSPVTETQPGDPLAGMSDDDVALAQARGTLTPEQELAWLKRQARALAQMREAAMQQAAEELPPAEPAELPDWLEEIRQRAGALEVPAEAERDLAEVFEAEAALAGDWLAEPAETMIEPEEGAGVAVVAMDEDVEALWAEAEPLPADLSEFAMPDSELAAFVAGDYQPRKPDRLAEALDEEYERRLEGDESEPEWYAQAVAQVAAETEGAAVIEEAVSTESPEWLPETPMVEASALAVAEEEMPDWLREIGPEAVQATEDVIPAWLAEDMGTTVGAADEEMPDWLREAETGRREAEPSWPMEEAVAEEVVQAPQQGPGAAEEHGPVIPVAPVSYPPVAAELPARRVAPVVPPGELFDHYRERLQSDPADHPTRLGLARALRANPETRWTSLDHYEVLIESAQLLQDVAADLDEMLQQQPEVPRLRRLLGDVYLRRGELQRALDAYRSALDRL